MSVLRYLFIINTVHNILVSIMLTLWFFSCWDLKKKKKKAANKASLSSDLNKFIKASNSHYKPHISRHCCKQDSLVAR